MDIFKEVDSIIGDYDNRGTRSKDDSTSIGSIELADNLYFSQKNTLDNIYYMTLSKYKSGSRDHLGREKPFYNVVNFPVDVEVKATDIDTANILIESDEPAFEVQALLLTKETYNWMKEINFAKTLNRFGETLSRYGGVIFKRSINGKELNIDIVNWLSVATDMVDINNGAIVEYHYMSPVELWKKKGSWENIQEAIDAATKDGNDNKSNQSNTFKVEVLEVEGEFPRSYITGNDEDEHEYSWQHYFLMTNGRGNSNDSESNIILFQEELKNGRNYKYMYRKEIEGRALGLGVVEQSFESQWWINDAKITEKRAFELAGKVLLKTNSQTIMENNVSTDSDTGDILFLEQGEDINMLNTTTNSMPVFQNIVSSWESNLQKLNNTFESVSGEELPSGTPFRLGLLQAKQAQTTFDYIREQKGIFLKEIFQDWVIPHLKKQINTEHILKAGFSPEELKLIDNRFAQWDAMRRAGQIILERFDKNAGLGIDDEFETFTQAEFDALIEDGKEVLARTGDRRFLEVPKGFFKDMTSKVTVVTTGEQKEKGAKLETMNTIFQTIANNPNVLQDPTLKALYEDILNEAGFNPIRSGLDLSASSGGNQVAPQAQPAGDGSIPAIEAATSQEALTIE
jgi:hypothetical protein